MHRRLALLVTCGLIAVSSLVTGPAGAAPNEEPAPSPYGSAERPKGVNPYLAFLPGDAGVDRLGWQRWMEAQGDRRQAERDATRRARPPRLPVLVDEDEPVGARGSNDTVATAQPVPGFGTAGGRNPRARLLGTLSPARARPARIAPNTEDDGALPLARPTGIAPNGGAIATSGRVGDGPHGRSGTGSGDFDWYQVRADAGRSLVADLDPGGQLEPVMVVFDGSGSFLEFFEGAGALRYQVRTSGTYYVLVTGFPTFQEDPFDSASGTGSTSEGPYDLTISVTKEDVDHYAVPLRKGDVVGASVEGDAGTVSVYGPGGRELHGSSQDVSFIYPASSLLPGGGNAVTDHVAERDGLHTIAVTTGDGRYDVSVEAYRPTLESERPVQTLFLDFDGERLNTNIWGGPGVRTLSPLRAFLGRWGLTNADHDRLIDRIVASVRESLEHDMVGTGNNDAFRIRILNSRDHADPFGQPNVSRVVVGGTIEESGLFTIGVAQSIDPGNFEQQESAVVLLDVLSGPARDPYSLNAYLRSRSDRVRFVGQAVGNIVSHEAGHFFGDWHVDSFNDIANLMDSGAGDPRRIFGVGPDNLGGTGDDRDVDFGEDRFEPFEGFTGVEDTKTRILYTLTSSTPA